MKSKTSFSKNKKLKDNHSYPFQCVELITLPGEQWEGIPALDGYYCISSLGRIKRMSFEIVCSNGYIRSVKEKMLKIQLSTAKNYSVSDEVYYLRGKITHEGKVYNVGIARMVYYCFIKKFDLSDYDLVVIAKDGNGKNIHPKNLALVNLSRKQKRIFERDRMIKEFPDAYDEFINEGLIKSTNPFCKQVTQYDIHGKKIQSFPSTKTASGVLGISESGINSVLKERQVSAGGYVWRYGKISILNAPCNCIIEELKFAWHTSTNAPN